MLGKVGYGLAYVGFCLVCGVAVGSVFNFVYGMAA